MNGSLRWDDEPSVRPGTKAPLHHRPDRPETCPRDRCNRHDWTTCLAVFLVLCGLGAQPAGIAQQPAHEANSVYAQALRDGVKLAGKNVTLPAPLLKDGMSADQQRAAMLGVSGSERALDDLLRDSVTAPFVMKVHDLKTDGVTVRLVDLWFVVRSDLAALDPMKVAARTSGKAVEVANMRFEDRLLTSEELGPSGRSTLSGRDRSRWYAHMKAQLLDRIELEATEEVEASRSGESLVIATRTDPAFDATGPFANRWRSLDPEGHPGTDQPIGGSISYASISRLVQPEGALLVEAHAAFSEPEAWFQGAPILRSKFAPIAQDQIRRLRRELRKPRP